MDIAIIGSGCIGLSVALKLQAHKVTIFSSPEVSSASRIAAGLINPLVGMKANLAYQGFEALESATKLITSVDKECIIHRGIFRPAATPEMREWFPKSKAAWCTHGKQFYPDPLNLPGIYIDKALAIDAERYMNALKQLCEKQSVQFIEQHISSLEDLKGYDRIIVAAGSGMKGLVHDSLGKLNLVKGQILKYTTNETTNIALSARAYLTINNSLLTVGATYEHFPKTDGVDIEEAEKIILPKIAEFWPGLIHSKPLDAQAGLRCTNPSSLPIISRLREKTWAIGALGSKGFLYHAWIAEKILPALLSDKSEDLPRELYAFKSL